MPKLMYMYYILHNVLSKGVKWFLRKLWDQDLITTASFQRVPIMKTFNFLHLIFFFFK